MTVMEFLKKNPAFSGADEKLLERIALYFSLLDPLIFKRIVMTQ